jgi:hypothetical protein
MWSTEELKLHQASQRHQIGTQAKCEEQTHYRTLVVVRLAQQLNQYASQ